MVGAEGQEHGKHHQRRQHPARKARLDVGSQPLSREAADARAAVAGAAISGKVTTVHRIEQPNWAPACEQVAMPLGSSSAAPVIRPGPSWRTPSARLDGLRGEVDGSIKGPLLA